MNWASRGRDQALGPCGIPGESDSKKRGSVGGAKGKGDESQDGDNLYEGEG